MIYLLLSPKDEAAAKSGAKDTVLIVINNTDIQKLRKGYSLNTGEAISEECGLKNIVIAHAPTDADALGHVERITGIKCGAPLAHVSPPDHARCHCGASVPQHEFIENQCIPCWVNEAKRARAAKAARPGMN